MKIHASRRVVISAASALLLGGIGFALYLNSLYKQLNVAFSNQQQFIPTRIYSDVTKISLSQPRKYILDKLRALAYQPKIPNGNDTDVVFTLHAIDYPVAPVGGLIPGSSPTLELGGRPITLHFTDVQPDSLLHSIEAEGHEIPEIYLEPELVATLSRGGVQSATSKQIRSVLKFEDIPANVWKAIIAVEDQHFLEHKGFDPRGLARAVWIDIRTRSLAQGGSTITQQLVKNLVLSRSKRFFRKINELFLAILLEMKFDKEQILERYLNEVYLGQVGSLEIHGVEEGAEHFFGKHIDELNLAETAMMAGLIRGSGYYSPYHHWDRAVERQHIVLKKMVETGQIAQAEADAAMKEPIRLAPPQISINRAPYFADFAKAQLIETLKDKMTEQDVEEAGFRVYTTLDMTVNSEAQQAVFDGIQSLQKRLKLPEAARLEGALASVDQSTGFVRALIGGSSYAQSNFNRILNMKRQVGSTFKPFVYLTAISKGNDPQGIPYGPGHPSEDAPWTLTYDHGKQVWTPRNYEKEFLGWISYRTALAHSINTVAAKLGFEIGIDNIIKTARALKIESDLPAVPSLSLGVAELSPIELLRAYAAIANHGVLDSLTVIRAITNSDDVFSTPFKHWEYHPQQAYDPGPTDLLTDMLQSVFTEGTAKDAARMGFDRVAAGKTGTTSNHRDSWFAGYTPQMTTVVWVGMDSDKATNVKLNLTGATSALPIWVSYMKRALEIEPPANFPESAYLVNVSIDSKSGNAAGFGCSSSQVITEKYLKSNTPTRTSCEAMWPPSMKETQAP